MAHKPRFSMPVSERAKQFIPFAAVKGLEFALSEKEHELSFTQKPDLSEETINEINETLTLLRKSDFVTITYFQKNECFTLSADIETINFTEKYLCLNNIKIEFDDILFIKLS